MARLGVWAGALLLTTLSLAGCLDDADLPDVLPKVDQHDHSDLDLSWHVKGKDCQEGGFVAAYTYQSSVNHPFAFGKFVVEPWERFDIKNEIGNPRLTSLVFPFTGPATGHWHQGIKCAVLTHNGTEYKEYQFGYVGVAVKPPPWDPGGADLHILLAGFGFQAMEPRTALRAVTTADITQTKQSLTTWYGPAAAYAVYDDVEKGTYSAYSAVVKYRDVPERTLRFWWTVPTDGSRSVHVHASETDGVSPPRRGFNPVYWDLKTGGGAQHVTPDSVNVGCHTGTHMHGPTNGACQHTLTNLYQHKTLELRYGGIFRDEIIPYEWIH